MTIASLIVSVGADIGRLHTDVQKIQGSFDSVGSMAKKVGGLIAGAFTISAVTSAISAYSEFTGKLTDLSAKTGIGVEALQRLKFAAEQNGGTLDQVTTAVTKLGANLAGGKGSAVGAMSALGLSMNDIRSMAPDKAFTTIADAIAKIPDPMAQSKLAMDLFGKSGADLLPMMKGNLSATANEAQRLGLVMGADAVAAGDKFGDTMAALTLVGQATIGQVLTPMIPALTAVAQWLGNFVPAAITATRGAFDWLIRKGMELQVRLLQMALSVTELGNKVPWLGEKLGASTANIDALKSSIQVAKDTLSIYSTQTSQSAVVQDKSSNSISRLNLNYEANAKAAKNAEQASKALAASQAQFAASVKRLDTAEFFVPFKKTVLEVENVLQELPSSSDIATNGLTKFKDVVREVNLEAPKTGRTLFILAEGFAQLGQITGGRAGGLVTGIGQVISGLSTARKVAAESGGSFGILSGAFDKSAKGSDRLAAGVAAGIGIAQGAINVWNAAGNSATRMGGAFNGAMSGAAAGAMFGPWGAAIGAVGGAIVGLFRGGANAAKEAAEKILKQNEQLISTLKTQISGFRSDIEGLIGKGAEMGYTFDAAGNIVAVKFDKMRDVAGKYGTDLASLGPAFQSNRLHESAQTLIDDFWLLVHGGADVGAVLLSMSPQINTLVNDSIKFGTKIPENMKPWIARLLEVGKLTDGNGVKMTDLTKLTFGEPVGAQFLTIQDAIKALIDKIDTLITRIAAIPTQKTLTVTTVHDSIYNDDSRQRGDNWDYNVPGFATGSGGIRDFGSGQPAILHGRERVQTEAQMKAEKQGNGGLEAKLDRLLRDLPRAMKIAVSDAIVLSGAR